MLSLIRVKNYAVIDEVELEFARGFSVMTGETGAGKSILVDALGLALGDRADASAVRSGAERAEISVQFDARATPLGDRLAARAWPRRRRRNARYGASSASDGRSRAFINGQPATLQDLKMLGGLLIDIHGQHAHQSLLEAASQRELLDAHGRARRPGQLESPRRYAAWQQAERDLAARREREHRSRRAARVVALPGRRARGARARARANPTTLRVERDRLANTDRLLSGVGGALDGFVRERHRRRPTPPSCSARQELERLVAHDAALRAPTEQLAGVEIELREVESSLNRYRDRIEADPARLDWLDERLAKFRAARTAPRCEKTDYPKCLRRSRARLASLDGGGESIEALAAKAAARARTISSAQPSSRPDGRSTPPCSAAR